MKSWPNYMSYSALNFDNKKTIFKSNIQELHAFKRGTEGSGQQPATIRDAVAINIRTVVPKFQPFYSASGLWTDSWKPFQTVFGVNSVQDSKKHMLFW